MATLNSPKKSATKRKFEDDEDDNLQSKITNSIMNEPSTSAEETQVSHNDSPASKSDEIEKLEVGDIVWAKIGKYPFWPSMVCKDPTTKNLTKGLHSEKRKFSLHVRFCTDHGRRSWAKTVEIYEGKDSLLTKYPNCLVFMKNNQKQMDIWNMAVREADYWLTFEKQDRWTKFSRRHNLTSPPNSPCKSFHPSTSAFLSIHSSNGTTAIIQNTDRPTQNVSKKRSEESHERVLKKKLAPRRKSTRGRKTEPPDEEYYTVSEFLAIHGNTFIKQNTGCPTQNVSEKKSEEPNEGVLNKKLAVKRKYKKTKKKPTDFGFKKPVPEDNYHIDVVKEKSPTTEKMVDESMKANIEKLEAEGIGKIKQWKALKTCWNGFVIMNGKKKN